MGYLIKMMKNSLIYKSKFSYFFNLKNTHLAQKYLSFLFFLYFK